MKKNKVIVIIICVILIDCTNVENKIILTKTTGEMISEFEKDWKKAHKYYRGRQIEISGFHINGQGYKGIQIGEYPIGNDSYSNYDNNHKLLIYCFLNEHSYFKKDEKLIIKGKYKGFFNGDFYKGIHLKDCDIISREVDVDNINMKDFFKIYKD